MATPRALLLIALLRPVAPATIDTPHMSTTPPSRHRAGSSTTTSSNHPITTILSTSSAALVAPTVYRCRRIFLILLATTVEVAPATNFVSCGCCWEVGLGLCIAR